MFLVHDCELWKIRKKGFFVPTGRHLRIINNQIKNQKYHINLREKLGVTINVTKIDEVLNTKKKAKKRRKKKKEILKKCWKKDLLLVYKSRMEIKTSIN